MPIPSFPSRLRSRRRAPVTDAQRAARSRAVRHAFGGALLALAVTAVAMLWDIPVAAVLVSALLVTAAFVVVDPGDGLLATSAPQPPVTGADLIAEVSTMRISLPGHELALAGAVGVYRIGRHSLAGQTADTRAIPQVTA